MIDKKDESSPHLSFAQGQGDAAQSEKTIVDLGDDLLEKTAVISRGEIQHDFESAKIFSQEGLLEDAKKVLRQILVKDPTNPEARGLLEKIQVGEVQEILVSESPKRPVSAVERLRESQVKTESVDLIVKKLDDDFGLNLQELQEKGKETAGGETLHQFDFQKSLTDAVTRALPTLRAEDKQDLGIAFLEMGFHLLALTCFDAARKHWEWRYALDSDGTAMTRWISAAILQVITHLQLKHGFEGTQLLEPMIQRGDIPLQHRAELYYWLGRSAEEVDQGHIARGYYAQVWILSEAYRDVAERLKKLERAES